MVRQKKFVLIAVIAMLLLAAGMLAYRFYKESLPYEIIFPNDYAEYVDKCDSDNSSEVFRDTILNGFIHSIGLDQVISASEFTTLPKNNISDLRYNVNLLKSEEGRIRTIIENAVTDMNVYFPDEPKKYFYVVPGRFYERGSFGGTALGEDLFILYVSDSLGSAAINSDKLRSTIVHEYTHTCDSDMGKDNLTLGNLAVMEGKAQYASALLVDYERKELDKNVEYLTKSMVYDMMMLKWEYYDSPEAYEHYQTAEFYAYGYKVVREYARNHPEKTLADIVATEYNTIINEYEV